MTVWRCSSGNFSQHSSTLRAEVSFKQSTTTPDKNVRSLPTRVGRLIPITMKYYGRFRSRNFYERCSQRSITLGLTPTRLLLADLASKLPQQLSSASTQSSTFRRHVIGHPVGNNNSLLSKREKARCNYTSLRPLLELRRTAARLRHFPRRPHPLLARPRYERTGEKDETEKSFPDSMSVMSDTERYRPHYPPPVGAGVLPRPYFDHEDFLEQETRHKFDQLARLHELYQSKLALANVSNSVTYQRENSSTVNVRDAPCKCRQALAV